MKKRPGVGFGVLHDAQATPGRARRQGLSLHRPQRIRAPAGVGRVHRARQCLRQPVWHAQERRRIRARRGARPDPGDRLAGAQQVREHLPEAVQVFVLPPSRAGSNRACAAGAATARKPSRDGSRSPCSRCPTGRISTTSSSTATSTPRSPTSKPSSTAAAKPARRPPRARPVVPEPARGLTGPPAPPFTSPGDLPAWRPQARRYPWQARTRSPPTAAGMPYR